MIPHRRPVPSDPSAATDAGTTASGGRTTPPPTPPPDPRPGDMIGPYRIVREIGRGGMAAVYEAVEIELNRSVALKVLVGPAAVEPQGKLRFMREAQAQAQIHHEHVVAIFRVGEDRGISYIAMPMLKGQTLAQALEATPRPPVAAVVRIASEIAEGLSAAHAAGLIHRDIKPSNVWLEAPKGRVKILDFGLARNPHGEAGSDITVQGAVLGTPAYMSPEQTSGRAIDHRTDLWSLGVVLYQMTTGQKPFVGDTQFNLMAAIIESDPPAPVDRVPDVPRPLSALVLRLLAKKPAHRPATADDVVAELGTIAKLLAAQPVLVVWNPVPASTPSAPAVPVAPTADPWNDIGATEANTPRSEREPERPRRSNRREDDDDYDDDYDDEPRQRRRGRRDESEGPRSRPWVWIGGAVVAALLLGGLVWATIGAISPKTKPTEPVAEKEKAKDQGKQAQTKPVVPDSDRAAAEALLPHAKLKVQAEGRPPVEVAVGGALPAGKLSLLEIDFDDNNALNPQFVTNTFLPALTNLRWLTEVKMLRWQMELSPEHLRQMAALPLAGTLTRLDAPVELTPAALTDLRKFTALKDVALLVPKPDDALFARFAELGRVEVLTFIDLSPADGLTEKGWDAVAKLPLTWFTMVRSKAAPAAFRAMTAPQTGLRPGRLLEFQTCPGITDNTLRELSERPTDVRALKFRSIGLSDEGLMHLAKVKSLKAVEVRQTLVTEDGARALAEAKRDLKVVHDDKTFGKKD